MKLTFQHIISVIFTLALVTAAGIYSGKKVKSSSDFSIGGKKANWPIVAGTIIGTLVGGSSTIGTAQMAYIYGFSAWWFSLGAGLGCLILALFFVKPLWDSNVSTVPQLLMKEYGPEAGLISSIFSSIGMFLNIIAQVLSIVALLSTVFHIPPHLSASIGITLMAFYVVFGGVWGTGIVGSLKMLLLYSIMLIAGTLAYAKGGGITGFYSSFPSYPWFSLFGRGFARDMAAGFGLVIGVLSTQTYIQAVISGKDVKAAKKGALTSAVLIPPIGIAGIFVGLYMKQHFPNIDPAETLPLFVLNYINPWIGGIALATLLITIVGTGAGLALGISTILSNDIYKRLINATADDQKMLRVSRFFIIAVLMCSLVFVSGNLKSLILQWSFLSMGLRGTAVFIPMLPALFWKGVAPARVGISSILLGPLALLVWKVFSPFDIDPLYVGILVGTLTIVFGSISRGKSKI